MQDPSDLNTEWTRWQDELARAGLLLPMGVPGVWGRSASFEDLIDRFDAAVLRRAAVDGATALHFPPLVARALIEQIGYLDSFPQLIGCVHSFTGDATQGRELAARAARGEPWQDLLQMSDLMLAPAACHPVYPLLGGRLPAGGRLVTVRNWCFRREPSADPCRLQSFRMREFVRAATAQEVQDWRGLWLQRARSLLTELGLDVEQAVAHDPFFGRPGALMAASQREQGLKFELLLPLVRRAPPTALCSFNWHQEHFSGRFGIQQQDGHTAHTACLGFGLERCVLALLRTHGVQTARWPASARACLWP